MSIIIPKTNSRPSGALKALESRFGRLPDSYKAFLNQHDGAEPEENIFKINGRTSANVRQFIPAADIIHRCNRIEGFPKNMLPFAEAAGGDYIYLNPGDGTIHFWDHEVDEVCPKVANSFDDFLTMLEKFDIDQIKLKPGQVKSVWVDPNFKPEY